MPGPEAEHGGTTRHGTARLPCLTVPCLAVPCPAVLVPCSARAARLEIFNQRDVMVRMPDNKRGVRRTNDTVLAAGGGLSIIDRSTFRPGDIIA